MNLRESWLNSQPPSTSPTTSKTAGAATICFSCDCCEQHFEAEQDMVGQAVSCPSCGKQIIVPASSTLSPKGNDVIFNCSSCGQSITIDEAGVGLQVECPTCRAVLVVPPAQSSEWKASDGEPTNLARRPIMSPAGLVDSETFENESQTPSRSWSNVWLPPRVSSGLAASYEIIVNEETGVRGDIIARKALDALRQLQASADVGLTCEAYAAVIAQASSPIGDFLRMRADTYPIFAERLQDTFQAHQDMLVVWRSTLATTTRFWGGGFGVTGFLIGAAISSGLNAAMDARDAKRGDSLESCLRMGWAITSAATNMLEDAMSNVST
jgi:DNA-directed RNA polymerase subunit RPC12/RpoP